MKVPPTAIVAVGGRRTELMDDFEYLEEGLYDLEVLEDSEDLEHMEELVKDDLEEAIRGEQGAAKVTAEGHPDRAVHVYNLELFRITNDLDEAIRIGQAIIESTPENHPDRVQYTAKLGLRFHSRYG
ncbi:hypothetical protein MMC22_008053 [Lobaria immixta]|nr:hypothetical protein [Lobaria immixta]